MREILVGSWSGSGGVLVGEGEVDHSIRVPTPEELLRRAMAEVPVVVFAADGEGRLTLLEGRGLEGSGGTPQQLVGRSVFDLSRGMPRVAASVRRALAGERVRSRHSRGSRTFDVQCAPLRDETGSVVGVVGWWFDVTDRARAEGQKALFARAADHAADAVLVTDAAGVIRYANAAVERLTGYPAAELLDRSSALVALDRSNPELYHEILKSLEQSDLWEGELVGPRKDGSEYRVRASISLVRDASERQLGTVCVARGSSEAEGIERRADRSQRLEAMGRLAGGIAHDFNNLLTAILGYAELCESEVDPQGLLAEGLAEIRRAAERGAHLTTQMLTFSRARPMRRESIPLDELLIALEGMLRRIIPENIDLRVCCDGTAGSVLGDRSQIEQVVLSLVVNAIDAMPEGGVLTLASGTTARVLGPDAPSGLSVLSVGDTGVGMTESQLEHIFEPFYTTKEVGKASGLGLATVHGIVGQCGGHVAVTSKPSVGTEFRVYLPKTRSTAAVRAKERTLGASRSRREEILYVEDDPRVRSAVERMLQSLGYRAWVAADADAAIAILRATQPSIDLLLTDVVMPGRSGVELAIDVRNLIPAARVLFVSGYADSELRPQLLEEPGVGFLAKPFQTASLGRALRELLDAPTTPVSS